MVNNLIDRTNLEDFLDTLESDGQNAILYFLKDPSEDVKVKFIDNISKLYDCKKDLKNNVEAILIFNGIKGTIVNFCSNNDLTLEDYLSFPELFFRE